MKARSEFPRRRATQAEIARRAGVTQATVSLVLNSSEPTPRVGEPLRKKILEISRRLNYRANPGARLLLGKRTGTVGIIGRNIASAFNAALTQEIEFRLADLGMTALLSFTHRRAARLRYCLDDFLSRGVDGVLCLDNLIWENRALFKSARESFPHLVYFSDHRDPGACIVDIDRPEAVRLAVRHLAASGHRRVAFVSWSAHAGFERSVSARLAGYRDAVGSGGLAADDSLVHLCASAHAPGAAPSEEIISAALDAVVDRGGATGIVCYDDIWALGMARVLERSGRRVPQDAAVVGLGNAPWGELTSPALTTVDFQNGLVADALVGRLRRRMEGGPAGPEENLTLVSPCLIRRESA